MNQKYIIALDSGTTSCRSLIVNQMGEVINISQQEITQYYPNSGWVEHDPLEIWNTQLFTMQNVKLKANLKSTDLIGLGITNQRETIVVWDGETGLPVYNAIVYQDRRTSDYCDELIKKGYQKMFTEKTGLVIDSLFSGTKLRWILKNVPDAAKKLKANKLKAGTIDSWLIYKLTNGKVHATDVSNASRTMLLNIHTLDWDDEILELFEIPRSILPEVKSSSEIYGYVEPIHFSQRAKGKVPISGVVGDQQAALFGDCCFEFGMVKNTYGTGSCTLLNTGNKAITSKNRLLTTIAWKLGKQKTVYALEGSVFVGGAVIQWLRDGIKIIYNSAESDLFASLPNDDTRVYMVPSFTGLGAPHWDSYSRGAIFGLERSTKREHLVKAALESIAYQCNDLILCLKKDLNQDIKELRADGGAARSNYLMQFQASISNLEVIRPGNVEATAMGASYLAGLAVGYWKSIDEIKKIMKIGRVFKPEFDQKYRDILLKGWNEAVSRTYNWTQKIK